MGGGVGEGVGEGVGGDVGLRVGACVGFLVGLGWHMFILILVLYLPIGQVLQVLSEPNSEV